MTAWPPRDDRAPAELEFVLARERGRYDYEGERCCGLSSDALALYGLRRAERPTIPGRPEKGKRWWMGAECGHDFPYDESDLRACERTYDLAPPWVQARMLPVLEEFRSYVREHRNRYGEPMASR